LTQTELERKLFSLYVNLKEARSNFLTSRLRVYGRATGARPPNADFQMMPRSRTNYANNGACEGEKVR